MHRTRYDRKRPLVAAREFNFLGRAYKPGDPFGPFEPGQVADRLLQRQYETRAVNYGEGAAAEEAPVEQVTMTGPAGGRYTISAPWLEEPEVVRGKVKAEKRLAELRADGAPLGFIEGGTAVTVEAGAGGWYEINAPWLDEAEKVQGREAAEARQRELHDAGEPDSYKGVTLTAGENGWFSITREGFETELKMQGEDNARTAAATLRAGEMIEGQPAEWETPPAPIEGEGGEQDPPANPDEAPAGGGSGDSGETTGEQGGGDAADPDPAPPEQTDQPGATSDAAEGGSNDEEAPVIDDKDKKPEDGDQPNEPGTNQPNGAEVINDQTVADAEKGEGDEGDDGEGTARPVGP